MNKCSKKKKENQNFNDAVDLIDLIFKSISTLCRSVEIRYYFKFYKYFFFFIFKSNIFILK